MKKLLLLIAGMLIFSGTAMANCGTCEGDAEKAKGKAAAEMKKMKCGPECTKPCCTAKEQMEQKKHKHTKMVEESKDKASEQAQQKRKKWWKFWGGEVEPVAE